MCGSAAPFCLHLPSWPRPRSRGRRRPTPCWSTARSSPSTTASPSRRRWPSGAQRILKVGSNAEIERLKGPATRTIDLAGRTVIPGLIDNHAHWVRAAEHDELRFDGVTSRQQALGMLAERVRTTRPGEWIVVLGGWSEEQFTDEPRGFPLEELDRIAPNNPVVLQAVYSHSYLNTVALVAAKIDAGTPDPQGGKIEKDAAGKPTGVVQGAGGVAFVASRVPLQTQDAWLANTRKLVAYLNSIGLTAWLDAGGRGMGAKHYEPYRHLAERGELNIRLFWTTIRQPATPAQVDAVIAEIRELKPFQGSDTFDNVGWGESVFAPVTTQLLRVAEQHQARGPGADAPHPAGAGRARHLRQFPRRDERGDRGLPQRVRGHPQGAADQGAALVVLAPRPGQRGAARAHEEARHDRRRSTAVR